MTYCFQLIVCLCYYFLGIYETADNQPDAVCGEKTYSKVLEYKIAHNQVLWMDGQYKSALERIDGFTKIYK